MKVERVGRRPRSIHDIYPARFEHSTDKSILQTLKATLLYQCLSLLVVRAHPSMLTQRYSHDECSQAFPTFAALLLSHIIVNANQSRPGKRLLIQARNTLPTNVSTNSYSLPYIHDYNTNQQMIKAEISTLSNRPR